MNTQGDRPGGRQMGNLAGFNTVYSDAPTAETRSFVKNVAVKLDGTICAVPGSMRTDKQGWWSTDGQIWWLPQRSVSDREPRKHVQERPGPDGEA